MLRTSFGRIRPGHPTTSYPGVAQLVARLLWEDRRSIHSPKSESPEVLGTVACGGNPPPEDPPAKPALTTALPTDTKNLLFPSPHGIMQKNRISGYSAVGSAPALGAGCRAFESHYSDQTMIIRTTLSRWVMCSDLSFLLRTFFDGQGRELISALVYLLFIHPNS